MSQSNADANPVVIELAEAIKAWWIEHHGDTTGPDGEWNVYETEPEFVTKAKSIVDGWDLYVTAPKLKDN